MTDSDEERVEALKQTICEAFARRPRACITREGLQVFWLSSVAGPVDRALDELVAEGRLRRLSLGGRDHYALERPEAGAAQPTGGTQAGGKSDGL